jgi:sulfonate transport system ATP-binding protein
MTAHVLPRIEAAIHREPRRTAELPAGGLAITARSLAKSFGDHRVLRGLDLAVPAGQFVAIVGRSGCGKSTLLRLLLGLDPPSAGEFWFGEPTGTAPDPGAVRIMFQEPRLLPWASILANVEVGGGAGASALDTLRRVGLDQRRGDWPAALSGGQKQRVALARALVSRPRVLALDEPLGALDALTRIEMQRLVEQVWLDQRFTALLVTHDVAEAVALADRVVMLRDGEIALDLAIDLPRPRARGSAEVAELEGKILGELIEPARRGMA